MVKSVSQARRVKARALESSAILLAVMIAGPAYAQCAPDPTVANGTTTCTGTDTDGLKVTTANTTVDVAVGAKVSNSGAPAIAIDIVPSDIYSQTRSAVIVAGQVDGGDQAGVRLVSRNPSNGYSSANLSMTVAAGGQVSGANGLVVDVIGDGYRSATVSIDNSGTITGTITGTNGYALLSNRSGYVDFTTINNRAGGTIGAIRGAIVPPARLLIVVKST